MHFLRQILVPRLAYILLGMALLTALIFTWGPAISVGGATPLSGLAGQVGASLLLPMGLGAWYLAQQRIRSAVQDRMSEALGGEGSPAPPRGGEDPAAAQEIRTIAARFQEALAVLRKRRFDGADGRRWLYQLPWYVVIGPPGSGKTTAITNSGLTFPLAEKFGRSALAGIGGTRNCDWWFTDSAVLIDTAGRYVTQDSAADRDKAGWLGFLRLLRRFRRRQPLNGVIVAIGIGELTAAGETARQEHAARIRQRVQELYRELQLRLPVYVLFTKSDLIAGFVEFFDDLDQDGRQAVWGVTFPHAPTDPEAGHLGAYDAEFDALVGRLDERLIERVQREGDIERRALIFGFPQQVASLKGVTHDFLQLVFSPNSFEEPVLLRGVYFVSGTQVGTPLDRLTEALARTFAMPKPAMPAFSGRQRSYFLRRLLHEVIFPEAGLVEQQPASARRRARLRLALYLGTGMAVGVGCLVWTLGFVRNARLIAAVRAEATSFATQADSLALDRVESAELTPVLPLLDRLRDLAAGLRQAGGLTSGLDQGQKLAGQAETAYRRALNGILLPRLILRLENVLATRQDDAAFLYEAFRTYLMLGQQGPLQRQVVRSWMLLDWNLAFPSEEQAGLRAALAGHLDALLEAPLAGIGLNGPLMEQVRGALQRVSLPRLVLNTILASPEAARLPAWRVSDVAGPAAQDMLRRRSGQPLTAGIPGIFTSAGFHGTFLRQLPAVAEAQAEDRWVLAAPEPPDTGPAVTGRDAARRLQREATELYLQEFTLYWDRLVGDLAVAPIRDLADALRVLNVLAGASSPIRLILVAAVRETALDEPPAPPAEAAAAVPARLEALFRAQRAPDTPAAIAGRLAAEHFRPLRQLVQVPPNSQTGAQAPIDDVIRDLDRLYRSLSELQGAPADPARQGGQVAAALAQIERGAASLPVPINQWILGVSRTSSSLSITGARQRLDELWRGGPGQLCQRATEGRFPFAASTSEVPLAEFGRLFTRGGTIDGFVGTNLAALVDTSRSPWRSRGTGPTEFRLSPQALAQFERAAGIRDGLFQDGGARPSLGFSMSLTELGPATQSVIFELDGRRLAWARGDGEAKRLRWPGPEGSGAASITFTGTNGAATTVLAQRGSWALFRLLAAADLRPRGVEGAELRVAAGPHLARFALTTESLVNPFAGGLLAGFRCPPTL